MATMRSREPTEESVNIKPALQRIARKLADCKALRKGLILVRATGPSGGDYCLESSDAGVRLVKGVTTEIPPAIEIIGDAGLMRGVLAGLKDARTHFLAGGFRIRGDLRYFSDLALELGILKEPL